MSLMSRTGRAGQRRPLDRIGQLARAREPNRVRPAVLAATVLLYLTLAVPVAWLIRGHTWLAWYIAFGLMVFAVGVIGRAARLVNGLVGLIAAALLPPAMIAAFAADVAWLLVIPNARVWDRFTDLGADLARAFILETSPLVAGDWIFAFVALAGGLLAWVFDWYVFTVRAPAATGLFAALVGVVAVAFVRQGLPLGAFVPMTLAYLILLAATTPHPRPRFAAPLIIALPTTLGLIAGLVTPGLGIGGLVKGWGRSDVYIGGVNPLVDLGKDLRASPSTEALRYRSSAGPVYLRLTTLSEFDGTTWRHGDGDDVTISADSDGLVAVPGADSDLPGTEATIDIEITDLNADWLPAPYQPLVLRRVNGSLRIDQSDMTVFLGSGKSDGQNYTVEALLPDPGSAEAQQLRAQPLSEDELAALTPYLALPSDLPPVIADTAQSVVDGVGTDAFDQALALEDFFRDDGFTYSMSTPAREDYDGDSGAVIARFLEVKAGYCVHFAVAMTLMARTVGLPARVAMGYLPGDAVAQDANVVTYSVGADRLHSWPEIYLPGSGWVGFEPTVSRASASRYLSASPGPSRSGAVPPPATVEPNAPASPSALPSLTGSPTASVSPSASVPSDDDNDDSGGGRTDTPSWWVWSLAVFALLTLVAALPGLRRLMVRRQRLRSGLIGAWAEIGASAVDLGLAVPPWRTPSDAAGELATWLDSADQATAARALERLATAVEIAAYAPPSTADASDASGASGARVTEDAAAVLRGLRRSTPWRARLVAWWSPRSQRSPRRSNSNPHPPQSR
ncbi:MAG: DUF3488 and transglutaminase-like domain-containing protein [Bifidobacteriaceae bacterium]|jgi:transglutaminase-like putative cysteine protease|nr:DUF3488 and transglutaminase-like domain-containing protein [Bifidobacteriaceae bacterium]